MIQAFRELVDIIKTNIRERKITLSLAKMQLKQDYSGSVLGVAWSIVRPIVYVIVFWFAIQIGLRGHKAVSGVPQLLWLVPGSFMWFFLGDAFLKCGKSLLKNRHLVTKMVFPIATIPVIATMSTFFVLLMLIVVVFIVCALFGWMPTIYWLELPYYLACAFLFSAVISMLISALSAMSRDISYLMPSVNQALFWLSPILWPLQNVPARFQFIIKMNPVAYLVEGIRNSLLYGKWFWQTPFWSLYFWVFLFALALFTASVWHRTKNDFADVL